MAYPRGACQEAYPSHVTAWSAIDCRSLAVTMRDACALLLSIVAGACMPMTPVSERIGVCGCAMQVTPVSTQTRPDRLSPSKLVSPLSVTAAAGKWDAKT